MQRLLHRLLMLILTAATLGPALLGLMAGMTTAMSDRQPPYQYLYSGRTVSTVDLQ